MANVWGNPELKSFKNNYIRRVIVDSARVFVHRNIVDAVEEVLIEAANRGAIFSSDGMPKTLPSHLMDDSTEAALGLKFQIPNFDKEIHIPNSKFNQVGDVFIFNDVDADIKPAEQKAEAYYDKPSEKIGYRQLELGMKGNDVKFLAYFLGLPDAPQRETFDADMKVNFDYFQQRMGLPITGKLDWYSWTAIMPKGTDRIAAGTAGIKVRVLQSALRVNGYNCPVTSRFGTETIRSVREFQVANNLRVTGRVGFIEWKFLFELK
jgi:hypothetical protein